MRTHAPRPAGRRSGGSVTSSIRTVLVASALLLGGLWTWSARETEREGFTQRASVSLELADRMLERTRAAAAIDEFDVWFEQATHRDAEAVAARAPPVAQRIARDQREHSAPPDERVPRAVAVHFATRRAEGRGPHDDLKGRALDVHVLLGRAHREMQQQRLGAGEGWRRHRRRSVGW